jgi:hypothetical protein
MLRASLMVRPLDGGMYRRAPRRLGVFAEILPYTLFEILGHSDFLDGVRLEHVVNDLPYPLTAREQAKGFFEPILRWNDFCDPMLPQLALDERDKRVARHRVELDAFAAQQKFDFFFCRAVAPQSIAYFGPVDIAERNAFRFETKLRDVGQPKPEIDNRDLILETVSPRVRP